MTLLAVLFVIVAPAAAHAEQVAPRSQFASAYANGLNHPDTVLASSETLRSLARVPLAPARLATSVVGAGPTLWVQLVACLVVPSVALLFTPRRRRAPPPSLFA